MQVSKGFQEPRQEAVREAEGNLDKRRSRRRKPKEEGEGAASLGGKPFMTVACGMFEYRRNRFIRLWLYSCLRSFLAFGRDERRRLAGSGGSGTRFSTSRGLKT